MDDIAVFNNSHYSIVFTNILSQNDAGQSGGMGGASLKYSSPGAASANLLIHSLDACYFGSG